MRLRRTVFFLAVLPGLLMALPLQAAPDTLSVDELMGLALERDEAARTSRAQWRHDEEKTTERLDERGQALGSETSARQGIASDEKPVAAGSTDTGNRKDGDFRVALDLRRLVGRFDLAREADAPADDGERCFVVAFRPRADAPPPASREDKVLNGLSGRFWLAQRDLSIVQSEGELHRPVSVAWVASVDRLEFRYHGRRLAGRAGVVVPASFTLDLGVTAPFYYSRQRQTTTMTNYQPAPETDGR